MSVTTVSDGTMPCPIAGPETGHPCVKRIPKGWTADEGHGGGHCWMSADVAAIIDGGHYDSVALISGLPAATHAPEDCTPDCPRYYIRRTAP